MSDSGAVTNLGEVKTGSVTRTKQVSVGPPFREGGIFLRPPLLGPHSTFCFIRGGKLPIDEARGAEEEEEERTAVDTTEVFIISMGFRKGWTYEREINRGGSIDGEMKTYTFLGSGAFVLATKVGSDTKLV